MSKTTTHLALHTLAVAALACLPCARPAIADSVTIAALKDNTLYESATGALSNGAGTAMFAGRTAQATNYRRRALIAFDVAAQVPAGATITGATLRLSLVDPATAVTLSLHRVLQSWGEGTSVAGGGQGSGGAATTGDATWLHRFYAATPWSAAGGDFDPTVSASTVVSARATYGWSSATTVADVQGWLDAPESSNGWLVQGDEAVASSAVKLSTREDLDVSLRPVLEVQYTPAPSAVDGGGARGPKLSVSPNPFRGTATLAFSLSRPAAVRLSIHDIRGRRVALLEDGRTFSEGTHMTRWDGRSPRGEGLPPGVYFARLSTPGEGSRTVRLLRIR